MLKFAPPSFPPRPLPKAVAPAPVDTPADVVTAPSTPDPYADFNDDDMFDEEGRLIIRTPVRPGPRPPATVMTPEIAARALGTQRPLTSLMNAAPRRPTAPCRPNRT